MENSIGFLNVKGLATLSFERSKFWSALMEKYTFMEDDEEVDPERLDELFSSDENEDITDPENEAEEVDVEEEDDGLLKEITNLSINKGDITMINDEQFPELHNFLNQTLPIFSEHQKQMQESGVEKILNTFDCQKIEEKVGSWLKRKYLEKKPSQKYSSGKCCYNCDNPWQKRNNQNYKKYDLYTNDDDDDDDSFASMDEANYIRETKLHRGSKYEMAKLNLKNNCKIKTKSRFGRMEAYRKSCGITSEDIHLEQLQMKKQRLSKFKSLPSLGLSKNSLIIHRYNKTKPEILKLRRDTDSYDSSSSSDEANERNTHRILKEKMLRRNKIKSQKKKALVSYDHRRSLSTSSSSFEENRKVLKSSKSLGNIHPSYYIADSSMSDWRVEESLSPKTKRSGYSLPSNNEQKSTNIKDVKKLVKNLETEASKTEVKTPKRRGRPPKLADAAADKEFEEELKQALKESKEIYRKEMKLRKLTKSLKMSDNNEKDKQNDSFAMADSRKFRKISLKKPLPPLTLQDTFNPANENTFFNASKQIVNSTALPNDSLALRKQFERKCSLDKNSPVSSTVVDFQTPAKPKQVSFGIKNEEASSSQVSSTSDLIKDKTNKAILIYTPKKNSGETRENCDGPFAVTKEHLSAIIGEKYAKKFFKHYVGRKIFGGNSAVYYEPPSGKLLKDNHNESRNSLPTDNDSDDTDILDNLLAYGTLYEAPDDGNEDGNENAKNEGDSD